MFKYKYKYKYLRLKYKYEYKYCKTVLEYNASTSTSTKDYISDTQSRFTRSPFTTTKFYFKILSRKKCCPGFVHNSLNRQSTV